MQTTGTLCALLSLLFSAHAEVVWNFKDVPECMEYFYKGKVPELGASIDGVVRLCQRFNNKYHFATLYDTTHRIPVYSAYIFQKSNEGGKENNWMVEPQLVDKSWKYEMMRSPDLNDTHPGVYQGEKQALDEDYKGSVFDRGHLNPNGHHPAPDREATFTLTNVVPQNHKLNTEAWRIHEEELTNLFRAECSKAFVLVGAVPSADNWIVKNNVKRVNIPKSLWNAYCCVDNNDKPVQSGAATAENTEENTVEKISLERMERVFKQKAKLFYNNCKP